MIKEGGVMNFYELTALVNRINGTALDTRTTEVVLYNTDTGEEISIKDWGVDGNDNIVLKFDEDCLR
jgi:hypothetical protein